MTMIARTRKRHVYKSLHETYGPSVRIGESVLISRIYLICLLAPNVLSVVDVDAIQPVLGPKGMPRGEGKSCQVRSFIEWN